MKVDFSDLKVLLEKLLFEINEPEPWSLTISRIKNGYRLDGDNLHINIEDDELDDLKSHEALLGWVMEYFNFGGSKHDPVRLMVKREKQK